MERLSAFKSKANEFAASQRGKVDSAKQKGMFVRRMFRRGRG